jgi:hypothetical protein
MHHRSPTRALFEGVSVRRAEEHDESQPQRQTHGRVGACGLAVAIVALVLPSTLLGSPSHRNIGKKYWMSEDAIEHSLYAFDYAGEPMLIYGEGNVYCEGTGPSTYLTRKNAANSKGFVFKHFACSAAARASRGQMFKGFTLKVHVLDWTRSKQPFVITNVKLR